MRVAVIGARGQLGMDLVRAFGERDRYEVVALGHEDIEVTDFESVHRALVAAHPATVVNCAAYVRVDDCEAHVGEALGVNAVGALNVARACAEVGAVCVFISSDYVFDGDKGAPYTEADTPRPINVYGVSKLAGERLLLNECPQGVVVRAASLFGRVGSSGKGGNFPEAILGRARRGEPLEVVDDVRMSPTYTYDAARAIECLVSEEATGGYHVTNDGSCTWFELAAKVLELAGVKAELRPVSSSSHPSPARRPRDSSLATTRLADRARGFLRPWEDGLKAYLLEKGYL